MNDIGRRIKAARVKRRLSLGGLARDCGLSKAHLWEIESGRSNNPSLRTMQSLASCLRCTIAWLIGDESEIDMPLVMALDISRLEESDAENVMAIITLLGNKGG